MTKDIKKRWSNNGAQYKLCNLFWKAIQKYKWDGFEHIVLIDNLTKEMACIIERELIKKYKTQNKKFGYNLADGGTGGCTVKGKNHHNSKPVYQYDLDGTFIKEWENAQRASETLNITVSDIHVNCRKENGVRRAGEYMWSYEKVEHMEPYVKLTFSKEPILQLDKDFNIVQKYNCISYVDNTIYDREFVTICCTRKNLTHQNYYWCYEKDFNDSFIEYVNNRIANARKNQSLKHSKQIYLCNLNFNILQKFKNAKIASEGTEFNRNTIQAYCKRPELNHGIHTGYIWVYESDYEKLKEEEISIKEKHKKCS